MTALVIRMGVIWVLISLGGAFGEDSSEPEPGRSETDAASKEAPLAPGEPAALSQRRSAGADVPTYPKLPQTAYPGAAPTGGPSYTDRYETAYGRYPGELSGHTEMPGEGWGYAAPPPSQAVTEPPGGSNRYGYVERAPLPSYQSRTSDPAYPPVYSGGAAAAQPYGYGVLSQPAPQGYAYPTQVEPNIEMREHYIFYVNQWMVRVEALLSAILATQEQLLAAQRRP